MSDAQRFYNPNGIAKTLKGRGGGQGAKTGLYAIKKAIPHKYQKTVYNPDGISPTFREGHGDGIRILENAKIRRLTPIECERLQAFPDNFTEYGINKDGEKEEISDTQRYKCLGNAVTTSVVQAIGTKLSNKRKEIE